MKTDFVAWFYNSVLHPVGSYIFNLFTANRNGLYILILLFIVLTVLMTVLKKIPVVPRILNFISVIVLIFAIFVAWHDFGPTISPYFKTNITHSPTPTNYSTGSNSKSSGSSSGTVNKQTNPQPASQTQKVPYYYANCSTCWNEVCNHSGYSYGGYDSSFYNYYKTLCDSCQCNDKKSGWYYR